MSQSSEDSILAQIRSYDKATLERELKKTEFFEEGMNLKSMQATLLSVMESKIMGGNANDRNIETNSEASLRNNASPNFDKSKEKCSLLDKKLQDDCSDRINQRRSQGNKMDSSAGNPNTSNKNIFRKDNKEFENSGTNKGWQDNNQRYQEKRMSKEKESNNKSNTQMRGNKAPVWKLNPLAWVKDSNDVPLNPPDRSSGYQTFNDAVAGSSDDRDKIITMLSRHLHFTAEICRNQETSTAESVFQWGKAIKIDETKVSSSRKIIDDDETTEFINDTEEHKDSSSIVSKTGRERRACTNKLPAYDYGTCSNEDRDNSSDDEFEFFAKRKKTETTSDGKKNSKRMKNNSVESITFKESVEDTSIEKTINDSDDICIDVSDENVVTDDETNYPLKKIKKSDSIEPEPEYPRRIIPPIPGKNRIAKKSLFRISGESRVKKKSNDNDEGKHSQRIDKRLALSEKEIEETLERNDKDDGDNSEGSSSNELIEIRPLRISTRMKMQSERLQRINEKEKEIEMMREKEKNDKEEAVRREKIIRVQKRIRDEKRRQMLEAKEEKLKAERTEKWKAHIAQREKNQSSERIELFPDGRPRNSEAMIDLQGNDSAVSQNEEDAFDELVCEKEGRSNRVPCPICNRAFTMEEIEAHAGACEEFDSSPAGISKTTIPCNPQRRNDPLLECNVCEKFSTYNGKQYENHVFECIERHKNRESCASETIVEVPMSPIRTVRTISEQTDSEINYKSQFSSQTRTNKNIGRKRKRH